jgi:AlwI restriction endonuclease
MIAPSRVEEVDFLLSTVNRQALTFKDEEEYKGYLFDLGVIRLLTDDRSYLEAKLNKLNRRFGSGLSIEGLKDLLEITEEETISGVIETTQRELRDFAEFDDILEVFDDILVKKATPDPPLYLEWNSWRAFVMLNDAKEIAGNFRFDLDGQPLSTAPGNVPDIRIDYEEFQLIVEVTMSSGSRQYEMEGEPVARHFGRLQLSSSVPVYCLFIAPRINENSMAHFFNLNRMRTALYGGRTRIIPISVDQFIRLLNRARDERFHRRDSLRLLLDAITNENLRLEDESGWMPFIDDAIEEWMT